MRKRNDGVLRREVRKGGKDMNACVLGEAVAPS